MTINTKQEWIESTEGGQPATQRLPTTDQMSELLRNKQHASSIAIYVILAVVLFVVIGVATFYLLRKIGRISMPDFIRGFNVRSAQHKGR